MCRTQILLDEERSHTKTRAGLEACSDYSRSSLEPLNNLKPFVPDAEQTAAVRALLKRTLPSYTSQILLTVKSGIGQPNGGDLSRVQMPSKVDVQKGYMVQIYGSTGVAAAWGLQQYLKECCYVHFSWDGNQVDSLPPKLPFPNSTKSYTSLGRFRYFANVCTFSYSMAWWDWKRWEQHIDWMALNGINLPLSFVGREAIWQKVYKKFGLSDKQIMGYFTGPAFLAWNWMGNLKNWGGPLAQDWLDKKLLTQQWILRRQVQLGMIPVLPGFSGHIPNAFKELYPTAKINTLHWGKFNCSYTCTGFLQPEDPLFPKIARAFMSAQKEAYGTLYHAYNTDLFNEMAPPSFDKTLISKFARDVYTGMNDTDPDAIWVRERPGSGAKTVGAVSSTLGNHKVLPSVISEPIRIYSIYTLLS